MGIIDWVITGLSLVYVILAAKNLRMCFVFGLLGSALWAYHDFANLNLKFDGVLQIFYVAMSIYGLYRWSKSQNEEELAITLMQPKKHFQVILLGVVVSVIVAYVSSYFFTTELPYLDATTTGMSIVATFLLIGRKLENWLYFIVIDLAYIYIYGSQGAYLLSGIMAVYIVVAVMGYFSWKKMVPESKSY